MYFSFLLFLYLFSKINCRTYHYTFARWEFCFYSFSRDEKWAAYGIQCKLLPERSQVEEYLSIPPCQKLPLGYDAYLAFILLLLFQLQYQSFIKQILFTVLATLFFCFLSFSFVQSKSSQRPIRMWKEQTLFQNQN